MIYHPLIREHFCQLVLYVHLYLDVKRVMEIEVKGTRKSGELDASVAEIAINKTVTRKNKILQMMTRKKKVKSLVARN
jgi:hypothetical protein